MRVHEFMILNNTVMENPYNKKYKQATDISFINLDHNWGTKYTPNEYFYSSQQPVGNTVVIFWDFIRVNGPTIGRFEKFNIVKHSVVIRLYICNYIVY